MIIIFFLKQCLSKSSVATSSFLISHPAPWSPLPPQALRHAGRTQPPGCSGTGCSAPITTRLCHCLHSQGWSPLPQEQTWPKYPVFKEERVNVSWDWWAEYLGKPSESQGKHTWDVLHPTMPRSSWQNCFSHPWSPFSFSFTCQLWESHFSEYYPTFFIAITLQVSSRLLVLHSKTCHGVNNLQPLLEKEKEERWSQQHRDIDVQFCAHLRWAWFPAAAR